VGILSGHRKSSGKLVVDGQDAALPPSLAVSCYWEWQRVHFFPYLIDRAEIGAVFNRVSLEFTAMDDDSIEELAV
jgi:hypothetical protein